jgi:RHS repeat-associated protein
LDVNGDHLGNIRLSYKDADKDGTITTSEIIEEKNYYPFGMLHSGYNFAVNGSKHNYGFGGKEEQDELGLGWIDITARNYDPALGRWMNLDPLAEAMRRHSPYNYAFDNPIYYIDPDGMSPRVNFGGDGSDENQDFNYEFNNFASTYVDGSGQIIHYEDDGDDGIYLVTNPTNGLNKDWQIGTERAGQTYTPGNYLDYDDLSANYQNSPQALPSEFQLSTYLLPDVEPQFLIAWWVNLFGKAPSAKDIDDLIKAASKIDKGLLTKVGRALQKHGSRPNSKFPKATGNPANMNVQGEKVLKDILSNPSSTATTRHHGRFGEILEIKAPNGQGVRFSKSGDKFIGFIE